MASKKDYVLTFITEFTVLLAGILVYKFAAKNFSNDGFSEYALTRRIVSFIHPVLLLGLGVGLPRYIALSGFDKVKIATYFIGTMALLLSLTLLTIIAVNVFSEQVAFLLFGFSDYYYLVFPISIMLLGMVLHSICVSYYRGVLDLKFANTVQILNMGIVPFIAFYFFNTVVSVILVTGILWTFISVVFILFIVRNISIDRSKISEQTKEVLKYGVQRIPGDILIAAFFALPAIFVSHISGVKMAGYVAFGISLLNMAGAVFGPICLIMLPQASRIIAKGDYITLKQITNRIFLITVVLTSIGLIVYEVFANEILAIYIGDINPEIILCSRIVMYGSIGYTVYISLRSILDAYYVKAVNTLNIVVSFLFFIFICFILNYWIKDYYFILYSFVFAQILLGVLTIVETYKIFKSNNSIKLE